MKTLLPPILKYTLNSALFFSVLIAPFVLFGERMEDFTRSFLQGSDADLPAMLLAGALLAGDPVLPTPSSVVATLLAARTGFGPAAVVNALALSLASVFGYFLGRGGGAAMARFGHGLPAGFVDWVGRHGLVAVLLCRPVPVLAEASLILAGAAGHEPRRLLAWCCITQTMLGIIYAFVGSGWGEGRWDSAAIFAGSVGIPLVAAAIVGASILLARRRHAERGHADCVVNPRDIPIAKP